MIFLPYLLSLSYTACTDHGTHSISHCSPGAGDLKSRKRFISRTLSQFYLKFVFSSRGISAQLKKKKKNWKGSSLHSCGTDTPGSCSFSALFPPWDSPLSFFCIILKFIFVVTSLCSRAKILSYHPWRVRTTFFTFPFSHFLFFLIFRFSFRFRL